MYRHGAITRGMSDSAHSYGSDRSVQRVNREEGSNEGLICFLAYTVKLWFSINPRDFEGEMQLTLISFELQGIQNAEAHDEDRHG